MSDLPEYITDGFGNEWLKCGPDCDMEVVRPGKVQCSNCNADWTPRRVYQLERELAAATREMENLTSDWKQADVDTLRALHERNEARKQVDALERENARLRAVISEMLHWDGTGPEWLERRIQARKNAEHILSKVKSKGGDDD